LLEENGIARENTSFEGDEDPCIKLQNPSISHLTTLEEVKFLTSSPSPPSPAILEAASMQHSPAINIMMLGISELDCHMDFESLHDMLLPITSEAARTRCLPAVNRDAGHPRSRGQHIFGGTATFKVIR
jgi:hypothetical protein